MMSDGTPGCLTLDQLRDQVRTGHIETVVVVFTDLYGRFSGKRFDADFFLESIHDHGTHACDYLLTVDMEMEPIAGYESANWERGYGDFHLQPDLATLRCASWLPQTALVLCDVYDAQSHEPVRVAPRSILKQQIAQATDAGYSARAGSELEYYLFRTGYAEAAEKGYDLKAVRPAGWYIEDYQMLQGSRTESFHAAARRHLKQSGVPVECTKGEWGEGQHELNVRYADVLEMADRQCIYKQCLKELADQQGLAVSFMAKFDTDRAGSSCHMHLSLWRGEDSVFAGEGRPGDIHGSDFFRWFLAGWMEHTPELMVCYAPTVNSYKRFRSASWAPTQIVWSRDNRTAAFRVVGEGASLRIECRLPGADCNPYLAYAAALASGMDGVRRQLEPPAIFAGDAYQVDHCRVPGTLAEAAERFTASSFARDAFGDDVVNHYGHFFRVEQEAFDRAVTDWERQRYFERI